MKKQAVILMVICLVAGLVWLACEKEEPEPEPEDLEPFIEVTFTPEGIFAAETTQVIVRARIDDSRNYSSVKLKVASETIATLYDDGDTTHADEIVGDNIYSCALSVYQGSVVDYVFTLVARYGGFDYPSDAYTISCFEKPTDDDIEEMMTVQDSASAIFFRVFSSLGESDAIDSITAYLQGQPSVETFVPVTNAIIINYGTGMKGGVYYAEDNTRGGRPNTTKIPYQQQTRGYRPMARTADWIVAADSNTVGSNSAFIYGAYFSDWNGAGAADGDESDNIADTLENSECPSFDVTALYNSDCTIDALGNLTDYGVIHLTTHGMVDDEGQVVFFTREAVDTVSVILHIVDIILGRIGFASMADGQYFWVRPGYISSLGGSFPNTIVYNASCFSMANNTMRNAFIGKGAGAYLGYDNVVNCDFAFDMALDFYPEMIVPGNKVNDAFTAGMIDPSAPNAEWEMSGNGNLAFGSEIKNPSFEEYTGGGVTGWERNGDARIITALVDQTPRDGSFMAIISTGLGFTTDAGSIEQTFCLSADATTLSLKWNMISEEWLEWVGSEFQDYIRITLETESGTVTLLNRTIDDLAGAVSQTTSIYFDQGDCYLTGWTTSTFDVSAYAGQSVTFKIATHDVGDSIYDTAVLIDDILVGTASI